MSRSGLKIALNSEHGNAIQTKSEKIPDWMHEFASTVNDKSAVTVVDNARNREPSIYDQMYSIMTGKRPLYSSVEEAVIDYQKKTGLSEVFKINSVQACAKKILQASEDDESAEKKTPVIFSKIPEFQEILDSLVKENIELSIPAILHTVAERFEPDGISSSDLDDPNLAIYINDLIINGKPQMKERIHKIVLDTAHVDNKAFESFLNTGQ